MEILHRSCAGIDIGKRSVTVCVITSGTRGEPRAPGRHGVPVQRALACIAVHLLMNSVVRRRTWEP